MEKVCYQDGVAILTVTLSREKLAGLADFYFSAIVCRMLSYDISRTLEKTLNAIILGRKVFISQSIFVVQFSISIGWQRVLKTKQNVFHNFFSSFFISLKLQISLFLIILIHLRTPSMQCRGLMGMTALPFIFLDRFVESSPCLDIVRTSKLNL